jgi:hypothetical protein
VATLYEYYSTNDDSDGITYGATWRAQTFTPATAHKITSVKLLLYRTGSPGTVTVSIRATDGSGHPTGADLCSGTTDGNTLPTSTPFEWREITLGGGYDLAASTKYAIVVRAPSGNSSNRVNWRRDASSPTYAGGAMEYSTTSGESWTTYTNTDYMFEDWGEPIGGITEKFGADTGTGADAKSSGNPLAAVSGGETGSGADSLPARDIALPDSGSGADALVSLQTPAAKTASDTGSGVDALVSLQMPAAKTSYDAGYGVEAVPVYSAVLVGSESGIGIEAFIARLLAAAETGYGAEASEIGGGGLLKHLFASELGEGADGLTAKIEMPTKGGGMRLWT